jgi:exopolyphosphatase/guanosine-5'-triphosphate,3'-diphosphate pyrophosphatase
MALSRESRVVVNKLAAVLRVADALVRGHSPTTPEVRLERQGDELLVFLAGAADVLLEERAIESKGDLFEDIYGMKIRLEPV